MLVGVVGVGRLGSLFARTLAAHPDVDGLVLAGSTPTSADRLCEELRAVAAGEAAAVFEMVDAVVIAASTAAHPEFIRRAAAAGLPTFCEKPITLDLASTDKMIDLVTEAGIELQIGFQRRFDFGYAAAREMVRSGDLGDLYLVRTAGHDPAPSPPDFIATSGDLFKDLVVHDFDALRFVTGCEIEEVFAIGESGFPAFAPYRPHGDHGIGVGTLRLTGGTTAVFTATRHDPAGYDIRMELFGSKASVTVGSDERTPLLSLEPGAPAPPARPYRDFLDRFDHAYRAEMHAFVELVKGEIANPCSPQDARAAFVAALAAGKSVREGRPVAPAEITP